MKKFEELPDSLIEIAEVRVENPEVSLKDLGNLLENPIGKSILACFNIFCIYCAISLSFNNISK